MDMFLNVLIGFACLLLVIFGILLCMAGWVFYKKFIKHNASMTNFFDGDVIGNKKTNDIKVGEIRVENNKVFIDDVEVLTLVGTNHLKINKLVANDIFIDKSIECDSIVGDVHCEGNVQCDTITGDVASKGNVECDSIVGGVECVNATFGNLVGGLIKR